jgi:hypothetical protein
MATMIARVTLSIALALVGQGCLELPPTRLATDQDRSHADAASQPAPAENPKVRCSSGAALRIGGWNLRKLGFEQRKDIARVADIIQRHFDLVALMEVVFSPGDTEYRALGDALGDEWQLVRTATPRPNLPSPHSEYYVVALRRARVSGCAADTDASLAFVPDGEGSDGSDQRGLFLREPAFGCFRTRGPEAGNDFALGVYHAEWGSGAADAIAAEVAHVDLAFAAMQARFPQERQRFLVGDFNLNSAALAPLTSARDRTRGEGSTLDTQGRVSGNLYDHLLAHDQAAERALCDDAEVLDVRGEAFDLSAFRDQVSDHLPLVAHLHVSADDD